MSFVRLLLTALCVGLVARAVLAQTDLPPALLNRPPVAAPTAAIAVAPIEVVRSVAEVINDFGGGLMQGLLASHGQRGAIIIAAQDDRIIVTRSFGCCLAANGPLIEGFYSDIFAAIAVMQLIERQRLSLTDPVAQEESATVQQVLTHQADPALLRQLVESASGSGFRDYVSQQIVSPLAGGQVESVPQIVGRLLVALLNEGTFEGRQILQPQTVALMTERHFALHPALPGWAYGFAEMQRNGWRGLHWDGQWSAAPEAEARLVVVPEANLAYFFLTEGRPGSSFWRALDDGLFDRILPQRGSAVAAAAPQAAAPDSGAARAVAGEYEAADEPLSSAAPLKTAGRGLVVHAREDGGLIVAGGETAVLVPRQGGYWAAEDGNLGAAAVDGRLILSSGLYRPLALWKRPLFYGLFALVFAVAAGGAFFGERRAERAGKPPRRFAVALGAAAAACLAAALFAWHTTPVFPQ